MPVIPPDRFAKTVSIPVRLTDGVWDFVYGAPLPQLPPDTIGQLVIPEYALGDSPLKGILQREVEATLLPTKAKVLIAVNGQKLPDNLREKTIEVPWPQIDASAAGGFRFVQVHLEEELFLLLRGTKNAVLADCKCIITAMGAHEAVSLNHAYAMVSQAFEPWRKSHSGNVFLKAFCRAEPDPKRWIPIDHLRLWHEAIFNQQIRFDLLYSTIIDRQHQASKEDSGREHAPQDTSSEDEVLRAYFKAHRDAMYEVATNWVADMGLEPNDKTAEEIPESNWAQVTRAIRSLAHGTAPHDPLENAVNMVTACRDVLRRTPTLIAPIYADQLTFINDFVAKLLRAADRKAAPPKT